MSFYQQKYFKPYHKIVTGFPPAPYYAHAKSPSPARHRIHSQFQPSSPEDTNIGGFQRSPFKHVHAEQVAEPIWEHLYSRGLQSQKDLMERHRDSKNRIDVQCTFQPILKHNKRYLANSSSTFLERVTIWQENKMDKMIREKEEGVNKDLKECTFAPQIKPLPQIHRKENENIAHNKSQIKIPTKNRNINPYYSPFKPNKESTYLGTSPMRKSRPNLEISHAKSVIRTELKRIAI